MEKILADLEKGIVAPCYLLYGEEEYLITESLNRIIEIIVPEEDRDFSLFFIDGEDADIDTLMSSVQTPSLLGNRKIVVVKNTLLFSSKQNISDIIQRIVSNIEEHPAKAVKYFLSFLKLTGLSLEDLINNGWKKISEEQWIDAVQESGTWEKRESWLPRVLDICDGLNIKLLPSSDEDAEEIKEILQKTSALGNCVIFTAQTIDKRKKAYKIIAEMGKVLYFGKVSSTFSQKEILIKETQKLLQKSGKKMTPAAWTELGVKTGWELRRSIMEIEKLIFFTGDRKIIEEKDVAEVVGKTKEDSVFDLTNALAETNTAEALTALKALLDQGMHHLIILTMLIREIRILLQARILRDAKKLPFYKANMEFGWFQKNVYPTLNDFKTKENNTGNFILNQHPFVIYNAWRNCERFSQSRLINILDELLEIDLTFKSSAVNPQILLENFLINTCTQN